ncbi:MAG: cryptochrome/photolyase family protein [Myxococcota bacterium]
MKRQKDRLLVLLGNQLFPNREIAKSGAGSVFMAESEKMCRRYAAHQHKLVLVLSAMRSKADALRRAGYDVHYVRLDETRSEGFGELLHRHLLGASYASVVRFRTDSLAFSRVLSDEISRSGLFDEVLDNPSFVTTPAEFEQYRTQRKRLFMADFYKWQRRRLGVLVDERGQPSGGKWSFDEDNRKPLPKGHVPPPVGLPKHTAHTRELIDEVQSRFPDHPGDAAAFWLPTTEAQARRALDAFLSERFALFGDYEDALSSEHPFVYHSVLSPLMNLGMLLPSDVLRRSLDFADEHDISINSLEGFVRQVIGWREFIRGVYVSVPTSHWDQNFWGHERRLTSAWYEGTTGIPPLDDTIRGAVERGYSHHIERLMVVGNLMLLSRIAPTEAYRWFMEMYVDSADWVMAPNVYGMALFSEGGTFTTKPYVCGSNYLRKMSDYGKGPWCDVVDGLYWSFVDDNQDFFSGNPRSKMAVRTLGKMDPARKERIYAAAKGFLSDKTLAP